MLLLLILFFHFRWTIAVDLKTRYEWKYIDFHWENDTAKHLATTSGQYDHMKIIPYDVQAYKDGRVWITTPRCQFTNPASVSTISKEHGSGGPLLQPYPSWQWHVVGNCSGITSAMKVNIDNCGRMWIVDSGKIGDERICPAQILAFDLKNDQLLTRYEIPDEVGKGGLLEINIVETEGAKCQNTWVYASDLMGFGFVIYDGHSAWRVEDEMFAPDPSHLVFTVANESVLINGGPSSIALGSRDFVNGGIAMLRSYTHLRGFAATIDDLHKSKYSPHNITWYRHKFEVPSQELVNVYSKDYIGFGTFATEMNILCGWLGNPLDSRYLIDLVRNDERLQFLTGMKVTEDEHETEILWVISNRFQRFARGTMNFAEINYRILTADVAVITNGTICQPTTNIVTPVSIEEKGFELCNH